MPVGRHHPHPVAAELPEDTVQDRPALFGGRGEGHVIDELEEVRRGEAPRLVELDRREFGKLLLGDSQQFEIGSAAFEIDALFTCSGDAYRCAGQLADDFDQFLRRERYCAWRVDICRNEGADCYVEIGPGESKAVTARLDQDVSENRKSCLRGDGR